MTTTRTYLPVRSRCSASSLLSSNNISLSGDRYFADYSNVLATDPLPPSPPLLVRTSCCWDRYFQAKIMAKASETENVVECAANEMLRTSLPVMYTELEKCQKSLEGYLEQKRNKFPRFYFVSNPGKFPTTQALSVHVGPPTRSPLQIDLSATRGLM